jgi:hypothetical protein
MDSNHHYSETLSPVSPSSVQTRQSKSPTRCPSLLHQLRRIIPRMMETTFLWDVPWQNRTERSRMVRDQVSRVDGERAAVHFLCKNLIFLSSVSPRIVSMNNEFSPVVLWLELSQYCKGIITIVLGVKGHPFWSATIKGNPNGFHAMVHRDFREE